MVIIILIWTGVIIYAGIIAAKKIKEKRETNEAEQAKERWFELNPPVKKQIKQYEKKKFIVFSSTYFELTSNNKLCYI